MEMREASPQHNQAELPELKARRRYRPLRLQNNGSGTTESPSVDPPKIPTEYTLGHTPLSTQAAKEGHHFFD